MLAGISVDYYLRLERGRAPHPSVQVLEAIGRVLRLDDEELDHLVALSQDARPRARRPEGETPPAGALTLLESLPQPAYIENRHFDVLAANALATALLPQFAVGANQLREVLLDPEAQAGHPDWEAVAECLTADLRQAVGSDLDDPRFVELTRELWRDSVPFRELWAGQEVRRQTSTRLRIEHARLGVLTLDRERLAIAGSDGLTMVVLHAEPGSEEARALELLSTDVSRR